MPLSFRNQLRHDATQTLQYLADESIFATGGQLSIIIKGEPAVDIAVGQAGGGSLMTIDALHNVYCLVKPMAYLLLGFLLEKSNVGPDEPLGEVVDLPSWAPEDLTYRTLATHDAALAEPLAFTWRITPPRERQNLLSQLSDHLGPAYSEISGGLIVEHAIEELSGQPPTQYCSQQLLEPLELSGDVFIDAESAVTERSRIRVPIVGLPIEPLPMLTELLPAQIREARLALGAYATMRGMARLYAAVGEVMAGNSQPGLPSPGLLSDLLHDDRPLRHDPILNRPAKWAGGLMTDFNQQGLSKTAGPGTVGHTAAQANSIALHDPSRSASVALYLNGVGVENHDHTIPRQQILDLVFNAIPIN